MGPPGGREGGTARPAMATHRSLDVNKRLQTLKRWRISLLYCSAPDLSSGDSIFPASACCINKNLFSSLFFFLRD